ncbi:hypothetical protein GALMADRAFT_1044278 [Galerina marginata CBS 339.88]|uniref:Uncharacterized protein n=1 Tax=Galerina marginata (strain CBS 339.88) TaxID=685588 RepID=A0A067SEJ9_GALM3|nr:hypothetical protein GALMADRAFT_1044278 [Galerina marginata CBS 339.88]
MLQWAWCRLPAAQPPRIDGEAAASHLRNGRSHCVKTPNLVRDARCQCRRRGYLHLLGAAIIFGRLWTHAPKLTKLCNWH